MVTAGVPRGTRITSDRGSGRTLTRGFATRRHPTVGRPGDQTSTGVPCRHHRATFPDVGVARPLVVDPTPSSSARGPNPTSPQGGRDGLRRLNLRTPRRSPTSGRRTGPCRAIRPSSGSDAGEPGPHRHRLPTAGPLVSPRNRTVSNIAPSGRTRDRVRRIPVRELAGLRCRSRRRLPGPRRAPTTGHAASDRWWPKDKGRPGDHRTRHPWGTSRRPDASRHIRGPGGEHDTPRLGRRAETERRAGDQTVPTQIGREPATIRDHRTGHAWGRTDRTRLTYPQTRLDTPDISRDRCRKDPSARRATEAGDARAVPLMPRPDGAS